MQDGVKYFFVDRATGEQIDQFILNRESYGPTPDGIGVIADVEENGDVVVRDSEFRVVLGKVSHIFTRDDGKVFDLKPEH